MVRESPVARVDALAGGAAPVSFERLEYGKLCTTHDGPIEPGVESYPLAASPGFSPLVEPFCRPWLAGIGADMVPGTLHGTILRCVRLQGRPVPLFCRLRQRPEGGEAAEGRRFWLGRYIYAGTVDPWTGFKALEERPLRGITAQEARAKQWAPIAVPRSPRPEADPLFAPLLQRALEHVLSGIPAGVLQAPDEESFFRWASLLWYLLPPALQPVFSAGWAVTPEVAQALHFSWSPTRSPAVALADVDRGTWTPPERVEQITPNGEVRSRAFHDDLLSPGKMFLRMSFAWEEGRPRLAGAVPRLDHLAGFDFGIRGADTEPAWVVDARSAWSFDRFRRPGLRSLDHARLQIVERWLVGVPTGDPASLFLSTRDYFYPDSRRRLLELGLGALETPALWQRADQIVWRSLADDDACDALLNQLPLPEREASRVRLFQVLARRDQSQMFAALAKAQELGGAGNLPEPVRGRLDEELARSLDDPALLDSHRHLLASGKLVEPYRGWAEASAVRLAVMLFTAPEPVSHVLWNRLCRLKNDPVIESMRHLQKGDPPTDRDVRALGSLSPELAEKLAERLHALWKLRDLDTRKRRNSLCPWMQAAGALHTEDPLIALLAPSAPSAPSADIARIPPEKRDTLAEEIRRDYVPSALQARVAALALREWVHFYGYHHDDGNRNPGWIALFKQWPAEAVPALADAAPGTAARLEVDPEVRDALALLSLPSSFLDTRIEVHLQRRKDFKLHGEVSRLLWQLCARAIQHPGGIWISDICRGLIHGELPRGEPTPPEEAKLEAAVSLASPHLESLPPGLWEKATQGWQIRFLLEVCPRADLRPTTEQLMALLELRTWLKKHLDGNGIHPAREKLFDIASRPFHGSLYKETEWRPEYTESPLWAAFRRVPLLLQGDLRKALETYSAGESHFSKGIVLKAIEYFRETNFQDLEAPERQKILEKLAKAAIAPLMRDGGLYPSDAARLIAGGNWNPRKPGDLQFHEDAYNAVDAAKDGGIVVAGWFKPLLVLIWQRQCQDEMARAIHKVAPEVWRR